MFLQAAITLSLAVTGGDVLSSYQEVELKNVRCKCDVPNREISDKPVPGLYNQATSGSLDSLHIES